MIPSCVTFRDQEVSTDYRKVAYKDWTELRTYIHNMAARDAIRQTMDDFEEPLQDGLPIAKELYRRGALSKHSVDMCDAAQFASIPSYTHNHNSFFSSMPRSLDDTFENWYHLLDILRRYPELDSCTDELESKYEENLVAMEVEKYKVDPPFVSSEEAKVIFEKLCDDFKGLWEEIMTELRDSTTVEELKGRLCYVFLDQREQLDLMTSFDIVFDHVRTRFDLTNFILLESLTGDSRWAHLRRKVIIFMRRRSIACSHISLRDFVHLINTSPKYHFPNPGVDVTFKMRSTWDPKSTSAFRYFWLTEVAFNSLTKHQYLHHIDIEEDGFSIYYATPDWVTPSILKLSREKALSLTLNGICYCSVLNEITLPNPAWNLNTSDYFDYMNSIIKISKGDVDGVLDTLDGCGPRKQWEIMDEGRKYTSYDELVDDFPKAVPWLPKNITMCDFFEFHESNHIWISSPFYTEMKGFKFALCVYPRGKGSGKGTHISVGVCLMKGELDDVLNFPVQGKIYIRLLNQLGDHAHVEGVYHFNDETRAEARGRVVGGGDFAPLALSIDQFIPLSNIDYNNTTTQYLLNECLYFQVMQTDFIHRVPRPRD